MPPTTQKRHLLDSPTFDYSSDLSSPPPSPPPPSPPAEPELSRPPPVAATRMSTSTRPTRKKANVPKARKASEGTTPRTTSTSTRKKSSPKRSAAQPSAPPPPTVPAPVTPAAPVTLTALMRTPGGRKSFLEEARSSLNKQDARSKAANEESDASPTPGAALVVTKSPSPTPASRSRPRNTASARALPSRRPTSSQVTLMDVKDLDEENDSDEEGLSWNDRIKRGVEEKRPAKELAEKTKTVAEDKTPATDMESVSAVSPEPPALPTDVEIGEDCLVFIRTCWFVGELVDFDASTKRLRVEDRSGQVHSVVRRRVIFWKAEEDKKRLANVQLGEVRVVNPVVRTMSAVNNAAEDETGSFDSLNYAGQVKRLRPHLLSIINEQYPPAQWRIDNFRKRKLDKRFLQRGDMTPDDEIQLRQALVQMVKDEIDATVTERDEVVPQSPQTRTRTRSGDSRAIINNNSKGSGSRLCSFWDLSDKDKNLYIHDVLLLETIIAMAMRLYPSNGTDEEGTEDHTEEARYRAAIEKLNDLQRKNSDNKWGIRIHEARMAIQRANLRTSAEEDRLRAETMTLTLSGRNVKKVRYKV